MSYIAFDLDALNVARDVVGEDDTHANWSRSGIRWALEDLHRTRIKEDNERDETPRP